MYASDSVGVLVTVSCFQIYILGFLWSWLEDTELQVA